MEKKNETKETQPKEVGFDFSVRGFRCRLSWDSLQYILTLTTKGKKKQTKYYNGVYQVLTELMSILPHTSTAGSMHEFMEDVTDCMAQIKKLGKYIENTFVPKTDIEMQKTVWGQKQQSNKK